MSTTQYQLLRQALVARTPCYAIYDNFPRFFCPHVIGINKKGEEQALCWQYDGETSDGPIVNPVWKCLAVAKFSQFSVIEADWHNGEMGRTGVPTFCVSDVDLKIDL